MLLLAMAGTIWGTHVHGSLEDWWISICLFIPDNTDMGTCLWGEYAVNAKQSMNTVGFEQGLFFCWKGEKRKRK